MVGELEVVEQEIARRGGEVRREGAALVVATTEADAFDLVRDAVVATGASIRRLGARRTTLEDIFLAEGSDG